MPLLILLFGMFCGSLAVLFIKASETDPVLLSAYRLLLGGACLIPLAWRAKRQHPDFRMTHPGRSVLLPAVFLAGHFISWIFGARLTPAANATLVVNMTPVVMPFVLFLSVREVLTRQEWLGTVIAISGVVMLGAADFTLSTQHAWGDIICFVSMLLYSGYLGFGSRNRAIPSIYLYVVPVYLVAGLCCLGTAILFMPARGTVHWLGPDPVRELMLILALALIPTVLGHSIINWAFKQFRGQVVSTLSLTQFIFAGIIGYLVLGEKPTPAFYAAAILAAGGTMIVIRGRRRAAPPEPPDSRR